MAPNAAHALSVREKVHSFLNAARTGNLDLLKTIAQQLDDGKGLAQTVIDVKDANKRGAFHFAAREGQIEVCKYFIEELKIDVNTKDEDGETPLIHAAREGHTATAKYLINSGADPSISSETGNTALHHSAGIGDIELLKFLLTKSINVDLESVVGTPLMWAAGSSQEDAVKVLLEHNANPNVKTEDDITPLLAAVAAGSSACVELLIKAGSNVNVTAAGGATPLFVAAHGGSAEIIQFLLQAGADPNVRDEDGWKPVQVAGTRGHRRAVEILFPVSLQVADVKDWSIDGILQPWIRYLYHARLTKNMNRLRLYASLIEDRGLQESNKLRDITPPKKDVPEVTDEAKKKAGEAKARGDDAFKRNDYRSAIDAYTKAIDLDPSDGTLLSNRSLCWINLGDAGRALADAMACRALRPNWAKACYRIGAAFRLLQNYEEAANAFYEGVTLDPENMALVTAFREAVESGRKFHAAKQSKS